MKTSVLNGILLHENVIYAKHGLHLERLIVAIIYLIYALIIIYASHICPYSSVVHIILYDFILYQQHIIPHKNEKKTENRNENTYFLLDQFYILILTIYTMFQLFVIWEY